MSVPPAPLRPRAAVESWSRRRAAAMEVALAVAIGALTARGRGRALDRSLYAWLNRERSRALDVAFGSITEFGSIWASAGAAVALTAARRRREALNAFGAAGAMWLIGQVVKGAVLRPRPYSALQEFRVLTDRPRGMSWPSSHPAVLLAFVTVASRELGLSNGATFAATALAGAVGVSRVALGVHYPADVAAGLLMGRAVADAWTARTHRTKPTAPFRLGR